MSATPSPTPYKPSNKHEILANGILWKKRPGFFSGWTERWFKLTPKGLFYYKLDSSRTNASSVPVPQAKPKGFIDLRDAKSIKAIERKVKLKGKKLEHAIEIVFESNNKNVIFVSQDEFSRNEWLDHLIVWKEEFDNRESQSLRVSDVEFSLSKSKSKVNSDQEEEKKVDSSSGLASFHSSLAGK
jgi:hypothetical protein